MDLEGQYSVVGPSGAEYLVATPGEVAYFEERRQLYADQNRYTNISDLQDVDRILLMETLSWRWSNALSMGVDHFNDPIDEQTVQKQIRDWSQEIRLLKKNMGMDKPTRDRDKGSSVSEYLEFLRRRALEFHHHRDDQRDKILILFNELMSLITLMHNADEQEQIEMHCRPGDIMEWIEGIAIPEYVKLDADFRQKQKQWIREL